jgi:type I restriction enzyme S subunit
MGCIYYISPEKFEDLKGFEVFPNDIIVSCAGTIGETYVMPPTMRKGIINQALMRVMLYNLEMADFYLLYFDFILKNSAQSDSKGTAIKNIPPFDILKQYLIPIPPIQEQKRIIAVLKDFDKHLKDITQNREDIALLVATAKSKILSLAIHGKLVPQDPNDEPASILLERIRKEREKLVKQGKIKRNKAENASVRGGDNCYYGKLPQNWAICTLSTIGQIVSGGTPKTDIPSYWNNGTVPWITPADLSGYQKKFIAQGSRMITKNGLTASSARILPKGSVLFSSRAPIGYIVIAATDVCTNQGFKSIVPYIEELSNFLYYFLKAQVEEIGLRASGTTFKEISGTEMGKTLIFLPPLKEQKRIITAIENSFEWLNRIFKNIS